MLNYGDLERHKIPVHVFKAMKGIERCRTSQLGYHKDTCEHCGHILQISYNSCRNRHCPKCQALSKERWIEKQKFDLLMRTISIPIYAVSCYPNYPNLGDLAILYVLVLYNLDVFLPLSSDNSLRIMRSLLNL
jgi:hypothetical protein